MNEEQIREKLEQLPFHLPATIGPFRESEFATAAAARECLARVMKIAGECFVEDQKFDLTFFVFCTRMFDKPIGNGEGVLVAVTLKPQGFNDWGKDMTSDFVAKMCRASGAVAVAWVSETWANMGGDQEDVERWRAAHKGSLAGHPNTREMLSCSIECARFHEFWSAEILTSADPLEPTKKLRKLGEWDQLTRPGARYEGRFMNLLKPVAEKEN